MLNGAGRRIRYECGGIILAAECDISKRTATGTAVISEKRHAISAENPYASVARIAYVYVTFRIKPHAICTADASCHGSKNAHF